MAVSELTGTGDAHDLSAKDQSGAALALAPAHDSRRGTKTVFLRHVSRCGDLQPAQQPFGRRADLPALVFRRTLGHRNRPANLKAPTPGRETSPPIRPPQIDSPDGCPRYAI